MPECKSHTGKAVTPSECLPFFPHVQKLLNYLVDLADVLCACREVGSLSARWRTEGKGHARNHSVQSGTVI
eukprot:365252-Chlamydomonas_euryale.AAC.33